MWNTMKRKFNGCYKCGGEKEPTRVKQSFCLKCHSDYMRKSRAGKISIDIEKLIDLINHTETAPHKKYFLNLLQKKGYNA